MLQKNYFSDTTDSFLLDYLFLQPGGELTETLLRDAQRSLEKYRKQIESGAYGMAFYIAIFKTGRIFWKTRICIR